MFIRHANVIELTHDGAALLPSITAALDMLDEGARLIPRNGATVVSLCTYQGFLMHWLIPRLGRFRDAHPEIDLNLMSAAKPQEFEDAHADITIKYGNEPRDDHFSRAILPDIVVPACSPTLARSSRHPLPPIDNLVHHTLLRSRYRRLDWPNWLKVAGAESLSPRQEITFRESGLANQAASQGLGVAIAQRLLIENELASGRLVMPFDTALRRAADIWMSTTHKRLADSHVALVCDWIEREARDTVEGFGMRFTPSTADTEQPIVLAAAHTGH
ncbi:LysR family transcriptional regulator [Salinisphaera sp. T31B1]